MKSISALGNTFRATRSVSTLGTVQKNTDMAKVLNEVMARLNGIEASSPGPTVEFEKNVGDAGAVVKLYHGLGGPVRYWVTYWTRQVGGSYPTTAPILVAQADTTDDELSLKSYVAGRAVIRVELVQAGIEK